MGRQAMAYRPVRWTEEKIRQFENEGRGQGEGPSYQPWLKVADVSSLGVSHRPWSNKTGRHHELLSDVEYRLFVCLEWAPDVLDIREQYPLDRAITQQIAQELEIRHPHYPGTHVPTVMTVDFLVTHLHDGSKSLHAYNAKRDDEAEDEKSLAKLEIQRTYFELLEIPHHLVFHSAIPEQLAKNADWIRSAALKPDEVERSPGYFDDLMNRMTGELAQKRQHKRLSDYCSGFDSRHCLEPGTGLRVARMLLQERVLVADLGSHDLALASLDSFQITGRRGTPRLMGA